MVRDVYSARYMLFMVSPSCLQVLYFFSSTSALKAPYGHKHGTDGDPFYHEYSTPLFPPLNLIKPLKCNRWAAWVCTLV